MPSTPRGPRLPTKVMNKPAAPLIPLERSYIPLLEFCRCHRLASSTVYRNRHAYPKLEKLGGKTVIMRTELERWEREGPGRPDA